MEFVCRGEKLLVDKPDNYRIFTTRYREKICEGKICIDRYGDLLNNFCISFTSLYEMSEFDIINKIKEITLIIGGQTIVNFTKESLFISLLLKNKKTHSLPTYNSEGDVVYSNYVPLSLPMIPLASLKYHEVQMRLEKEKPVVPYKFLKNIELIDDFKKLPKVLVLEIYKWVLQFQNIYRKPFEMKIGNDCIDHLPLHISSSYLIEQYTSNSSNSSISSKFRCKFSKNIKYIAVIVSKKEKILDITHKIDPIIGINTYINNILINRNNCLYLRKINSEKLGLNHMPIGVYLLSYSLKPGELEQTGSLNFDRIHQFEIEIEYPPSSPNYYIKTVGCNNNIFKVISGMGGIT
jgi:hypothetical protein